MAVTQKGLSSFGDATAELIGAKGIASPLLLGDQMNRALKAALKATTIGRQSDKQIEEQLAKARKAMTRQMRRMAPHNGGTS